VSHQYSPGVLRPALALLLALTVLMLGSGCASTPSMTADDAVAYTRNALTEIGLREVQIVDGPRQGEYGTRQIPVWEVEATVDGGQVALAIERQGSYIRFVRDVANNGGPLLNQQQVDQLSGYSDNPAADRRRDRTVVPGVVAAVLLSLTVAALAGLSFRRTAARRSRAE
jgi:hypothetical protein